MSSQMSSVTPLADATTRRELNPRQAETVDRLVNATLDELRAVGFEALTVRTVAARAAVAPATGYTYFASKNHLVAEAFWRRLAARPRVADDLGGPLDRVVAVFHDLADFLTGEQALAAATTTAMLASEPEVKRLRGLIAAEIQGRLAAALGEEGEEGEELEVLGLAWAGSMLQAGMGHATYEQMGDQLARVARFVMGRQT